MPNRESTHNFEKNAFSLKEIRYLGYIIAETGVKTSTQN